MRIDRVTITGADDLTNVAHMVEISKEFPFVEWGILFSVTKAGQKRYPTHDWRKELYLAMDRRVRMNLSAHLCGAYSGHLVEHGRDLYMGNITRFNQTDVGLFFKHEAGYYDRYQVNYQFRDGLFGATEFAFRMTQIAARLGSGYSMILQHNKQNAKVCELVRQMDKGRFVEFLFDESGGRGKEMNFQGFLPHPLGTYTGYAGGIGLHNIDQVLDSVDHVPQIIQDNGIRLETAWIDMESAVRRDDRLDLDQVAMILEKVRLYNAVNF